MSNHKTAVVVFSKDRPMQLEAYLESMMYNTGISENHIYVIANHPLVYKAIEEKFPMVSFIYDQVDFHGFGFAVNNVLSNISTIYDTVLFGCDDVVYINNVDVEKANSVLEKNDDVFGVSFRLGTNISSVPRCDVINSVIYWNFRGAYSHWGYPFELMGTLYRISDCLEILNTTEKLENIKTPNFFESDGVHKVIRGRILRNRNKLACLKQVSGLVAQDVNRVQDEFPNKFTGTKEQTPGTLIKKYNSGTRLNWKSMQGIAPSDCFVGDRYWKETQ